MWPSTTAVSFHVQLACLALEEKVTDEFGRKRYMFQVDCAWGEWTSVRGSRSEDQKEIVVILTTLIVVAKVFNYSIKNRYNTNTSEQRCQSNHNVIVPLP